MTGPMLTRALTLALTLALALVSGVASGVAEAAPTSASAKVGTDGASSSASGPSRGFKLPDRVIGGDAISVLMPVQVGFLGYMPRVRIGFQFDYQLYKQQWVYVGVAALFDRGNWENFRLPECGLGNSSASCGKGPVAGFDLWAGWAYKFYLKAHPYLVPFDRVGAGGGWWKYPALRGTRLQSRESSWTLSARFGGGLRFFLLTQLGIGVDLNFVLGFTRSKDTPLAQATHKSSDFLFGMEILPLIVEYRF
jgi:hypothetical protein